MIELNEIVVIKIRQVVGWYATTWLFKVAGLYVLENIKCFNTERLLN